MTFSLIHNYKHYKKHVSSNVKTIKIYLKNYPGKKQNPNIEEITP